MVPDTACFDRPDPRRARIRRKCALMSELCVGIGGPLGSGYSEWRGVIANGQNTPVVVACCEAIDNARLTLKKRADGTLAPSLNANSIEITYLTYKKHGDSIGTDLLVIADDGSGLSEDGMIEALRRGHTKEFNNQLETTSVASKYGFGLKGLLYTLASDKAIIYSRTRYESKNLNATFAALAWLPWLVKLEECIMPQGSSRL